MCLCPRLGKDKRHSKMTTSSSEPCALPLIMMAQDVGRSFTMPSKFQPSGKGKTRTSGDSMTAFFAMHSSEPQDQTALIKVALASCLSWSCMSKQETTAPTSPRCLAAGASSHLQNSRTRGSINSQFKVVAPPRRLRFGKRTSGRTEVASRPCRRLSPVVFLKAFLSRSSLLVRCQTT